MDISQRASRPSSSVGHSDSGSTKKQKKHLHKFWKMSSIVLLFSATVLFVAILFFISFGRNGASNESGYVETDKHQAVFLNGGQVYFGKITDINSRNMTLQDIYYLQVDQQVQPDRQGRQGQNDITLVKLGCELHGPEDLMVIKQDQVIFWENLKNDGRVAEAVKQFKSQNPNGLDCNAQAQQQNNNGGGNN